MRILVRFGELTLKSRPVRQRFITRLKHNIRDAFQSEMVPLQKVEGLWDRMIIESTHPTSAELLTRIFGIHHVTIFQERTVCSLDDVVQQSVEFFASRINGRRFAVRVRRRGNHSFRSIDAERAIGAQLIHLGKVDLTRPEVTCNLEIRDHLLLLHEDRREGVSGLPLGVSETAVLQLLSGGFDSGVAAWLLLRKGIPVHYLCFDIGGALHRRDAWRIADVLAKNWSYGYHPKLYFVDFRELVEQIRSKTEPAFWNIVLRRAFYRVGYEIARQLDIPALATGESIGQVSSQTLLNLVSCSHDIAIPVLRPLLTYEKIEIIQIARRIGTYDFAAEAREYCSVMPRHPKTRSSAEQLEAQEINIDPQIFSRAAADSKKIDLRSCKPNFPELDALEVRDIPVGALVVDLRDPQEYQTWHYPGSVNAQGAALRSLVKNEQGRELVLHCNASHISFEMAHWLRGEGLRSFFFKGGTAALRRYSNRSNNESFEK